MKQRSAVLVITAVLFALPFILQLIGASDREVSSILGSMALIMIWALFALSFNLLYGVAGQLSLGHSLFMGAGALGVGIAATQLGLGFWPALAIGVIATGLFAILLGRMLSHIKGDSFWVATAVMALIGYQLVLYFGSITGGASGLRLSRDAVSLGFASLSFTDETTLYLVLLIVLVLIFAALRWLAITPLGKAFTLIRENEEKAALIGYSVKNLKWAAFAISGSLAGLSGALLALAQRSFNADLFQWTHSVEALAWVVVGGAGTLLGPLLGTGLGKGLEEFFSGLWLNSSLIFGVLLILIARFSWREHINSISSQKRES